MYPLSSREGQGPQSSDRRSVSGSRSQDQKVASEVLLALDLNPQRGITASIRAKQQSRTIKHPTSASLYVP